MLHSLGVGAKMPRKKKPEFEFSPEQLAVWLRALGYCGLGAGGVVGLGVGAGLFLGTALAPFAG